MRNRRWFSSPRGRCANLPESVAIKRGAAPLVFEKLVADTPGDLELRVASPDGNELCRANPMRVVASAPLRRYWGDLHGQSGETVGTNPARSYFRYARDKAFVDIVGHQGNDFQITDEFWQELNRLTAEFDVPGKFVCVPGYEWSGNTGMGGDRNVFYRREGRPIHRSSHILIEGQTSTPARYTAHDLFEALKDEDAVVIAHVGGRYADIKFAHDGRLERAVEVHSTWGTFEWLLHDAFEQGYRVGVVCHSDDHKGRPGATRPGASTFGAIGGLTCYLMPELTRDALFDALRARRHYGTTGTRLFLDVRGTFAQPVTGFSDDPQLGPAKEHTTREAMMGDIVRPGQVPMQLDRRSDRHRADRADRRAARHAGGEDRSPLRRRRSRPPRARAVGGRGVSRARPRDPLAGQADARRQSHRAACRGQLPQPGARVRETRGGHVAWLELGDDGQSWPASTFGSMTPSAGTLTIETNVVSGTVDLASLADETVTFDGGGLGRRLSVYRLPEQDWSRHVSLEHTVDVRRRRRSAGLCARHPGRRPSGLVEPDLSDCVKPTNRRARRPSKARAPCGTAGRAAMSARRSASPAAPWRRCRSRKSRPPFRGRDSASPSRSP